MTFSKPRPAGFVNGTRLLDSELNSFQNQLINAVDGYNGGTYNLQSPLNLEGDVVGFDTVEVSGTLAVVAGATFGGTLNANDITTADDVTVGDDLTVNGDASIVGSLVAGLSTFLLNNTNVVDSDELLFDGFQSTPIRYYTGTAFSLVTEISPLTTVYHWFWLINAQSTTRIIANEGGGTITTLTANTWCVVAKISTLNDWRVIARGSLL